MLLARKTLGLRLVCVRVRTEPGGVLAGVVEGQRRGGRGHAGYSGHAAAPRRPAAAAVVVQVEEVVGTIRWWWHLEKDK